MPTHRQDRRRTHRVRVLLADDYALFAETLAVLLASDGRLEIVGRAADGVEATRRLRTQLPVARVHMLSSSAAVDDVERARAAGAAAYLTKDADRATIVQELVASAADAPKGRRAA